ncbi:MAG: lipocalin family protein [Akkermansia sp.]|nr:lipocalin family protein [Akkermansia sp.]
MILKALFYYLFCRDRRQQADTTPAPGTDLSRYLGRWYELARFDTPFEAGLEDVYTEYRAREGGSIRVSNYGVDAEHRRHEAHAIGYPVPRCGQMKVAFVPLLRWLSTPYNILHVDANYTNALVSNGSGSCLWFLSRRPTLDPDSFDIMRREALRRGFDLSDLHYTRHRYK